MTDVPLKVLIIDPDDSSAGRLYKALKTVEYEILSVKRTNSLSEAVKILADSEVNSIYIDPLLLDLESASRFIFNIRKKSGHEVFVLYLDYLRMEQAGLEFYSGERKRFEHYHKLDKGTPVANFIDKVKSIVMLCQVDLSRSLSREKIQNLQSELVSLHAGVSADTVTVSTNVLKDIQRQLESLKESLKTPKPEEISVVKAKSVFLSYRFAESEYVKGLTQLLEREGFSITTGQEANTYISQAILERIRSCEFFMCVMTRGDEKKDLTFSTSSWLLEEKGAAIAMGKKIVLMVEEGISDIGGLQGDWQRNYFNSKSFTSAAIQAVDQLKSYLV